MKPIGADRMGQTRGERYANRAREKTRAERELDPDEFDGIDREIEADIAVAEEDAALRMPRKGNCP